MLPFEHLKHQGPATKAIGETIVFATWQKLQKWQKGEPDDQGMEFPGPEINAVIPARPDKLVSDYCEFIGAEPGAYDGLVPPHLFPQWTFPYLSQSMRGVSYPVLRTLNGGCRLELAQSLPAGEPLEISTRLENIDDDGRRAVIHMKSSTGTQSAPKAMTAQIYAVIPLKKGDKKQKKAPICSPEDSQLLARLILKNSDNIAFALLTGDINPLHWIPAYAWFFGFKNAIAHGYHQLGRTFEIVNRYLAEKEGRQIKVFDARFSRSLVVPGHVGVYLKDNQVFVSDQAGTKAYLTATFE